MEKDNGLYELIYDYYRSRILFGCYRYGEPLSSVSQICSSFQVGKNTVLAALAMLEENGYIVTEERKVATLAYQGNKDVYEENAANYFVPRKEGIQDFLHAGKLLFLPMWEAGLHNMERGSHDHTYTKKNSVKPDIVTMPVKLYVDVLQTFHNDLMLNLYWQCLRYINFLYPRRNAGRAGGAQEELPSDKTVDKLNENFNYRYVNVQNEVMDFIESATEKYHMENIEQIPFKWTVCRRRPQVRYTLASTIIREILWERYPAGSYLPSLPKMAEQYQVSLSTVRRTLAVLQSLGVTKTHMGIGTKVCLETVDFDVMNASGIRENLRLHGEAMQILALTVSGITLYTMQSVTEEKRTELLQGITELKGKTSSILCIDVLLSFISRECPSMMIRECYGKLRELITWGYILSAVLMESGQLESGFEDVISQLEEELRSGRLPAFADRWQTFIENRMDFFYSKYPLRRLAVNPQSRHLNN